MNYITIEKANELIEIAYNNAKEKGFYDNGFDASEKGALIVSEIAEALEANRSGINFPKKSNLDKDKTIQLIDDVIKNEGIEQFKNVFLEEQKDSFEDEIADVYVRLFDMCGALGKRIEESSPYIILTDENKFSNWASSLFKTASFLDSEHGEEEIDILFASLNELCIHFNINIEKHIEFKMLYNSTRPIKHGKKF